MALVTGGTAAWALAVSLVFPPPEVLALVSGTVGITGLAGYLARFERRRETPTWLRILLVVLVVALPVTMFGTAMALWGKLGGLDWSLDLSSMVLVTGLGAIAQSSRRHWLFTVQLAGWTPVALLDGSTYALGALSVGLIVSLFASHRQSVLAKEALVQAGARDRVSRRAEQLLRDFEEMGQGWFWETDRRNLVSYLAGGRQDAGQAHGGDPRAPLQ